MTGLRAWSWSLLVGALAAQEPFVETGKHFVLEVHRGPLPEMLALRLADEGLAAVEGAWPAIERLLLPTATKPLRIVLYHDEAAFRSGAGAAAAPFARRGIDPAGPVAHVLAWPVLQATDLERIGLPVPVRNDLVLAAAEVAAAQKAPTLATDPWLTGVFAYAVLEGKAALAAKYGVDPLFDSRRWQHHVDRTPRSLRHWVTTTAVPDSLETHVRFEESMCLTAQLVAGGGGDWARRWLAPTAKAADAAALGREAAVERLLGKNWTKIEARWQQQLRGVTVPIRVRRPVVQMDGQRLLLVGTPDKAAMIESENTTPAGSYRVISTVTLADDDGEEEDGLRVQLAWDGTSWIGAFLRPGEVELADWRKDQWWKLGSGKAAIERGKPFDVVVEIATEVRELRVIVAGDIVLRWDYGQRDMHGAWSIAKNQRPAWIEGLRVEALGQ